ncbi:hypothetical protein [Thermococcus prieurii]
MAKKKDTSERVLHILAKKVAEGKKLSKHEREILAVVTHEALKKDHRKHHKKAKHHHKKHHRKHHKRR